MYITQETDYAIRIVYCLAKSGARRDARSISEEMCVSLRFALKILGKLAQGGLVSSFKGCLLYTSHKKEIPWEKRKTSSQTL